MKPYTFVYRMPDGRYSKHYATYLGCFRAARKVYPLDTDRMIYKVNSQSIKPILER